LVRRRLVLTFALVVSVLVVAGTTLLVVYPQPRAPQPIPTRVGATIELTSGSFGNNSIIPTKYTCDGADVSPPLTWKTRASGVESFALVMYDADTPQYFTHWILFNIPSNSTSLPENLTKGGSVPGVGSQGRNDFGAVGYGGPCPPSGATHHYWIVVYALDAKVDAPPGSALDGLVGTIRGHILATGLLVGTYGR
jgi:Raf kinase inhibitor-like YbhB/YbcL family protein